MANRKNFYFKQFVTEAELDDGLKDFEDADWNQMKDLGQYGIASGFGVVPDPGGPSFNVNVISGAAVDKLGRRLASAVDILQTISTDTSGAPTIPPAGNRRWISIYARYGRVLSDTRIDGLGNTVHFLHNEVLNALGTAGINGMDVDDPGPPPNTAAGVGKFYVVAGTPDLTTNPLPSRPALHADAILLADILYTDGDANITIGKISTARAERFAVRFDAALPPTTEFGELADTQIKYALILEASGQVVGPSAGSRNRIYMSTDGFVITHNASWDPEGRVWVWDSAGDMSKIHFYAGGIKIFSAAAAIFDDQLWTTRVNLNADPLGGPFLELGTDGVFSQQKVSHCVWGHSFVCDGSASPMGSAFTYNIPFSSAPSSVTAAVVGVDVSVSSAFVFALNKYGGKGVVQPNVPSAFTSAMRLITATF